MYSPDLHALTEQQHTIHDLETRRLVWKVAGAKEAGIREELDLSARRVSVRSSTSCSITRRPRRMPRRPDIASDASAGGAATSGHYGVVLS